MFFCFWSGTAGACAVSALQAGEMGWAGWLGLACVTALFTGEAFLTRWARGVRGE